MSLIEAGIVEFGWHGYSAAQTSAIARRAGVSQPNVYANFASKADLFLACVAALDRAMAPGDSTDTPPPATPTPSSTISSYTDDEARLLFQAVAALRDPAVAPELGAMLSKLHDALGAHESGTFDAVLLRGASSLLAPL